MRTLSPNVPRLNSPCPPAPLGVTLSDESRSRMPPTNRVTAVLSDQVVKAMKEKNLPVVYVLYGDEGLFASYADVQFRAPVQAGDVLEVVATVTRMGTRSRLSTPMTT